ncbi:MAG: phage tail sheath subtilisin-like domain-containing protein [Tildeniella torsiva UHER 1998/13D]|jgi:hypothetical protein|nr:phage tail sheath subtilisin-like domain-containing protein [Tildeniella torsiva UHER 1998/13D]
MPEYLAPGVYVEETSFRAKSIEGVSTSTAGFVGLTRRGPVANPDSGNSPELLTSFGDFERIYGGLDGLTVTQTSGQATLLNYLAHGVRAFFNEGGARLYVSRVFLAPPAPAGGGAGGAGGAPPAPTDGRARVTLTVPAAGGGAGGAGGGGGAGGAAAETIGIVARFPGAAYNGTISFRAVEAPASARTMDTAPVGTLLRLVTPAAGGGAGGGAATPTTAYYVKGVAGFGRADGGTDGTSPFPFDDEGATRAFFLTLNVITADVEGNALVYEGLGFGDNHPQALEQVLVAEPTRRSDQLQNLYAVDLSSGVSGFELFRTLFENAALLDEEGNRVVSLTGGTDGGEPTQAAFEAALAELAMVEDISIVAAPGCSVLTDYNGIQGALISHAEQRKAYRSAILDTPPEQTVTAAREIKSRLDSKYAALYFPWVRVSNPLFRPGDASIPAEISLPPSGFMAGIYARNDIERGVFKAPANEVVRSALRFEREVNFAEQESLNPFGVNCLRFFPGRGYRVWGARTISSDPEWKYVNVRRYFNYLEQSIDRGTQWAVFEPNGTRLWTNVRDTIAAFLYNEWITGALLGATPQEAFFVRCDRSTMTQNDLDNGRLICLIGVAVLKPAEFVIFRIGQKTADAAG